MSVRPFVVAGRETRSAKILTVRSPYDGASVASVARAGPGDLEAALEASKAGFRATRGLAAWRRHEILVRVAERLAAERERFARTIALEAGKPIVAARAEVDRAVLTVRTSAEEALRIGGEVMPLDVLPGHDGRWGLTRRFPVGPVACITPFNFPLNLVAHKIAPAFAAGCPFLLKPASKTPLSALDLAALFLESGAPAEAVSVLPMAGADAAPLAEDPRIRAVSFTGSPEVGWELRRRAFRKKVVLELGGNAGVFVDRTADLELAATRSVAGAFGFSGQSCISVQRIFAHEEIFDAFAEKFLAGVSALATGDPLLESTTVGPVISSEDAERIETWVGDAVAGGARLLAGGGRRGALVEPTVLTGTRHDMSVCAREVFGPVAVLEPAARAREAFEAIDRSEFGLQAGIFTHDLPAALAAFEGIEVGAVIVNDVPTYRADPMPYGGVKSSGSGREGPRWAVEDYTEMRLLVVASP